MDQAALQVYRRKLPCVFEQMDQFVHRFHIDPAPRWDLLSFVARSKVSQVLQDFIQYIFIDCAIVNHVLDRLIG